MPSPSNLTKILQETSRTFFIPISRLPGKLKEAVASAYLCMRAIDEIEDHPDMEVAAKQVLLNGLGPILEARIGIGMQDDLLSDLSQLFMPYRTILPEVTLRIGDWLSSAPVGIAPRIWDATMAMSERMGNWVNKQWKITNQADLDGYTFSVAGAVGLLICDIWAWFDGSQINREIAVGFGRGLQAVNILRNRREDLQRGVNFYPTGWTDDQMFAYAHRNLTITREGIQGMPGNSFTYFVDIPLRLAEATLGVLKSGMEKLSREQVMQIVNPSPEANE